MTADERRLAEALDPGMSNSIAERWAAAASQEDGEYFGSVTEYGIWTGKLDLDEGATEHEAAWLERELFKAWGPYLLIQEDDRGFINVAAYQEQSARDAEYDRLEALYLEWDEADECQGHPDDDNSIAAGMPMGETHYCDGSCRR